MKLRRLAILGLGLFGLHADLAVAQFRAVEPVHITPIRFDPIPSLQLAPPIQLGINVFDTSPDYGKGLAEGNLGRALRTLRHDTAAANAIISTKVEIMPPDLGDIAGKVVRSVDDSLRRLGRDVVDILMIHNPPRLDRDPSA